MLQRGARGAVRLGKEVCVCTSQVSLLLPEKRGGIAREKEGEMNGKTVGWEATETYARDNLPIYHSLTLIKS